MKTKLLFLFLLLASLKFATAQKLQLKIGGNFQSIPSTFYSNEFSGFSFMPIPGSSTEVQRIQNTYLSEYGNYYDFKGGGQLELNIKAYSKNRFQMRLGLEFSFSKISINNNFINSTLISSELLDIVEVEDNTNPLAGLFNNSCVYQNSFQNINPKDNFDFSFVDLQIPVYFVYDVIPNRLQVSGDLFFSTPIFSSANREFVDVERIDSGTSSFCTYVLGVENDHSGNYLRNANWGGNLGIIYWLNQFGIEMKAGRKFANTFIQEEDQSRPYNNFRVIPNSFSLSILYRL